MSTETGEDTDFVILMSGEPQGAIKMRRHGPDLYGRYDRQYDRSYGRSPAYAPSFDSGWSICTVVVARGTNGSGAALSCGA